MVCVPTLILLPTWIEVVLLPLQKWMSLSGGANQCTHTTIIDVAELWRTCLAQQGPGYRKNRYIPSRFSILNLNYESAKL